MSYFRVFRKGIHAESWTLDTFLGRWVLSWQEKGRGVGTCRACGRTVAIKNKAGYPKVHAGEGSSRCPGIKLQVVEFWNGPREDSAGKAYP